jgi:hypothetical protein
MFNSRVNSVIFIYFLVAKTCHFAKKKSPKQHGEGNYPLEIFQKKKVTFSRKKVLKIFGIWADF